MAQTLKIKDANGLSNHTLELRSFINNHDVDIILIIETQFTEISYFTMPKFYHI